MGDGAAERAGGGALGVDVDPLVVVGGVGEGVDALLVDGEPGAVAEVCIGICPTGVGVVSASAFALAAAPRPRQRFEIELSQTGRTLEVPADASILDVVRAAGVQVLYSCTEGTCGTCETDVLSGVPDHRDSVLTTAERAACDTMMICVSRAKSDRLVLDL